MGVALTATSIIFAACLTVVFFAWHASEKTLSVHTIVTTKRELFYWAAILFTFSLGTSAGDLIAEVGKAGLSALGPAVRHGHSRDLRRLPSFKLTRSSPSGSPTSSRDRSAPRWETCSRSR